MSISITDIGPALTGDALIESMGKAKERRKAIVEGLIYDQTILMVSADPGAGKSTIATQLAVELAAGIPAFGVLHVPKPCKVLYVQTERSILEFLERLEIIRKIYPIVKENLTITDEYQRLNLLVPDQATILVKCVQRDCPGVEVIFFDPIYCMVSGGLKEDVPASAFTHAMSRLQKETGAALYYNHHTVKQQYANGVKYERDDPFYGSTWLKAHATGAYYLKEHENGVKLLRKKDNYRVLLADIELEYDPETGLSTIPAEEIPAIERVRNFIKLKRSDGKTFTFKELEEYTKLSTRCARQILVHSSVRDEISIVSSIKNKNLYKVCALPSSSAEQIHTI